MNGRVCEVPDEYTVAINRGDQHGVKLGMVYAIGVAVFDPDTNEYLGSYPGLHVRVCDVYEKFCVAETFMRVKPTLVTVRVGDQAVVV